jgi:hypothetical protein
MNQAIIEQESESEEVIIMATETIGKDLLGLVIQECKVMPKVWQQLSQFDQDMVIDRARYRIESAVRTAIGLIVSDGYTSVIADLEGVAIKDDIKATFKVSRGNPSDSMQELFSSHNQACRIILSSAAQYTGGMDEVRGESEQSELDLAVAGD